ncbi:iron-containing alcohol dehydrogenase [Streptomyces olivochromogenes]|uniref:iron-containing alcohol dehydrogenase n=1 Tax=Streptomyces olivochromogenes TaxID=1963 RepID=UPI000D14DC53|nr:iron-containing alcohol dehydrogenase [Streptomyces olivochromogenes]
MGRRSVAVARVTVRRAAHRRGPAAGGERPPPGPGEPLHGTRRCWEHARQSSGRGGDPGPRPASRAAADSAATAVPGPFDALAHAAEALYAPDRTPVTDLLAVEGVRALATALPGLSQQDPEATATVLHGAWRCGRCLDATTLRRCRPLRCAPCFNGPGPELRRGPYVRRQQVQQVQGRCSGG